MTLRPLFALPILVAFVACTPMTPPPVGSGTAMPSEIVLRWNVTPAKEGEFDQPNATLSLMLSGAVNDTVMVGTYAGSFAKGEQTLPERKSDALLYGMFWWAGAGDEFAIVRAKPDTLEVRHRGIDEQAKPGEFETLKTVKIPADATVRSAD